VVVQRAGVLAAVRGELPVTDCTLSITLCPAFAGRALEETERASPFVDPDGLVTQVT
jgi:hypothetical protein